MCFLFLFLGGVCLFCVLFLWKLNIFLDLCFKMACLRSILWVFEKIKIILVCAFLLVFVILFFLILWLLKPLLVVSGCFGCRRWLLVAFGFSRLLTLSLVVNIYLFFARVFVCFDFVLFFTKPVFCCYYFIFSILLFVVELLFVWFGLLFFIFKVIVYLAILFWFRKLVFVFLLFLLLLDVVLCFY